MRARTVGSSFERVGLGVHMGRRGVIRVEALPAGSGLQAMIEGGERFPIDAEHSRAVAGCTILQHDGVELMTPEHLLAALVGCGITDALVRAKGPEVPILDGSATPWCEALAQVGWVDLGPIEPIRLEAPLRVEANGGIAQAWPASGTSVEVDVDFGDRGPSGAASIPLDTEAFARDVAWARTFALADEIEALRAAGRGLGATAENTAVWGPSGPIGAVRGPDEAVRHKLLDLVGDLALAGRPICARIHVFRGSHRLHHAFVRALRAQV